MFRGLGVCDIRFGQLHLSARQKTSVEVLYLTFLK